MKKSLYLIGAAVVLLSVAACQEKEGTEPGKDGSPLVTAYQYDPGKGYNADEDVKIRFVKNDKVKSAFFLEELSSAKKAAIEAEGEDAYIAKVLEQGTEIEFEDGVRDTVLTGLANYYDVTVVAINGGKKVLSSLQFSGLAWKAGVTGTYTFGGTSKNGPTLPYYGLAPATVTVEFQQCEFDDDLYRFKDVYGPGKSLKIRMTDDDPVDDGRGTYQYFRVADQTPTGLSIMGYDVYVRDIGYAVSEDYFYALGSDYDCGYFLADGSCNLNLQYYCGAGSLGYAWDEHFTPNS